MSRIRGLELLFNLEKKNIQSKEDCVIIATHCLLINENLECSGTGDEWPETDSVTTELLPENWNINQDVYSLRYRSKDKKKRVLLKAIKMEHILQIDTVMNEDDVASFPVPVNNYIADEYRDYSTAYKDLESFANSFRQNIIENFDKPKEKKDTNKSESTPKSTPVPPLSKPSRSPFALEDRRDPLQRGYPRIGGSDLDPFGGGGGAGGGMFMDPSGFGVPARPTLPQFGVGGPGGLPRGAVPPGARFDPFMPPIGPGRLGYPNPDHFPPPDFEDFM